MHATFSPLQTYLGLRLSEARTREELMEQKRIEIERLYAKWEVTILSRVIPFCNPRLRLSDRELEALGMLISAASRCTYDDMRELLTSNLALIIRSYSR